MCALLCPDIQLWKLGGQGDVRQLMEAALPVDGGNGATRGA